MKLFDSELNVLEVLWREGECSAKHISLVLTRTLGWNKNTTYTVIKKCVDKGLIQRTEPGFQCKALITKQEAEWQEISTLADRMFSGSLDHLLTALLDSQRLTPEQISSLRAWLDRQE